MTDTMVARGHSALAARQSVLEEAIEFTWDFGTTPEFTRTVMKSRLDVVFSAAARAFERQDRHTLAWLADKCTAISHRLLRNQEVSPRVYFAVYTRCLGDLAFSLSASNNAIMEVHERVKGSKHMLRLVVTLGQSKASLTPTEIARRLSLKPNNLTYVLKQASEAGVITCAAIGRQKHCSLTRLGKEYLEEHSRPVGRAAAEQLLDRYWQTLTGADDFNQALADETRANPAFTEEKLEAFYRSATEIRAEEIARDRVRRQLERASRVIVSFGGQMPEGLLPDSAARPGDVECDIIEANEQYAHFLPLRRRTGAPTPFEVPYRDLLSKKVKVRKLTSTRAMAITNPGFKDIRVANDPNRIEPCGITA